MSGGEHEAVERVWVDDGPRLWRSLLAFSADADVASDAMAEAFAQALGRGPEIRDHAQWIWRAAFRIAAGDLQSRRREVELTHDLPYDMPESTADLVGALRRLSPNQRAVVVLRLYAGMPSREVASVLGIAPTTVRVHLMQARRRLRPELEEHDE
ncbi:MAG: sigma factor-like helix-turn-helix DNA-binding protein [Actinomycetota bacterium]